MFKIVNKLLNAKAFVCCILVFMLGFSAIVITKANISAIEQSKKQRSIDIAFSMVNDSNGWDYANRRLFQKVFKDKKPYMFRYSDAKNNDELQKNQVINFIETKANFIIINPISPYGWTEILQTAKDAGIYVIFISGEIYTDNNLYVQWVGTNYEKLGNDAAAWLKSYLAKNKKSEKKANIVSILNSYESNKQNDIKKGFDSFSESSANWNLLTEKSGNGTDVAAKRVMGRVLDEFPELNVVVCHSDNMLKGVLEALEEAERTPGEDVTVISFDGTEYAFNMLEEKKLNMAIEITPDYGTAVKEIIEKVLEDNDYQSETLKYLNNSIFLPETAAIDKIGRWY